MLPPKEFVLAEMIISHVSQATNVQGTSLLQKLLMLGLQLPAEHSLEQSCDSIDVPCCYIERQTNVSSLSVSAHHTSGACSFRSLYGVAHTFAGSLHHKRHAKLLMGM